MCLYYRAVCNTARVRVFFSKVGFMAARERIRYRERSSKEMSCATSVDVRRWIAPRRNSVGPCRARLLRAKVVAGLDQEFNSLDAQYDSSRAYIRSQAHAGWTLVKTRNNELGFSSGSTDRPALQRLLANVKARKVHLIAVYKVDRLTRSLADVAKLVELSDAHGVSLVRVTQRFNRGRKSRKATAEPVSCEI